jgi:hypothetical protein
LRLGRYLRNAGSMDWIFECQEYDRRAAKEWAQIDEEWYRRAVEEWTKIHEDCLKEGSGSVDTGT